MSMERPELIKPPQMPPASNKAGLNLGGGFLGHALTVIASVVICFALISMGVTGALTQQKFDEQIKTALDAINKAKTELVSSQTALDKAISGIDGQVSTKVNTQITSQLNAVVTQLNSGLTTLSGKIDSVQSQLQTAVTNANKGLSDSSSALQSITNINTTINSIKADLTAIHQSINTITAQITALTNRIVALETPPPSSAHGITIKLTRLSDSLIPTDDTGNATANDNSLLVASFKLVLTNTTTTDAEDVIVSVLFQTEIIPYYSSVTLTSSPALSWIGSGWFSYSAEYHNTWGLEIEAGKSKTLYMTLTFKSTTQAYITSYGYEVEAEVME